MPLKKYLEDDYGRFATARAVRLHLIEEVRRNPRIYTNSRLSEKLREAYFVPITRRLGYRREMFKEVYGAWKSLREAFKREQRKIDRGQVAEGDTSWAYYKQMKWLASVSVDDDDGDNLVPREEEEDEEEGEPEEPMVLDGGQGVPEENVNATVDDHRNDLDGDANGAGNDHDYGHDNHDDNDDNAAVDVGVLPLILPAVEYYVEQPAYLERLPELMDAIERQLESTASWQALFGQTVGMRLRDLPKHKQGSVVDAINKIFNDVEAETAAEADRELPPSTGPSLSPAAQFASGDMSDKPLQIDENYDPGMHSKQ